MQGLVTSSERFTSSRQLSTKASSESLSEKMAQLLSAQRSTLGESSVSGIAVETLKQGDKTLAVLSSSATKYQAAKQTARKEEAEVVVVGKEDEDGT